MSQRLAKLGSSALALTVCMPVMVSTSMDWFSAPRANLTSSRWRRMGTMARLRPKYSGMLTSTMRVNGTL